VSGEDATSLGDDITPNPWDGREVGDMEKEAQEGEGGRGDLMDVEGARAEVL
jgi:hypothetical protein